MGDNLNKSQPHGRQTQCSTPVKSEEISPSLSAGMGCWEISDLRKGLSAEDSSPKILEILQQGVKSREW